MARDATDLVRFETENGVLFAVATGPSIMGGDGTAIGNAILDEVQACRGSVRTVAFDLARVSSVNSVLLGALVTASASLQQLGVELVLVSPSTVIRDLLTTTRLERVFRIEAAREDLV